MSDDKIITRSKNSLVFSTEIISFFYEKEINDIVEVRRLAVRKSKNRQHFIINRYNDFKNAKRHDEIINIGKQCGHCLPEIQRILNEINKE